uniref:Uncharacterized protein n=1 Tax=Compsopogon caeruleus TaxID=31354 RepID=A0A7S1TFQ8_9RHOD|mmetsp:Transcript_4930/g.9943  ORF Transcript_4930/g.9943 Transcript_4930/m.9943 type:complete len:165 (+) Transcript_4930:468-962(+)
MGEVSLVSSDGYFFSYLSLLVKFLPHPNRNVNSLKMDDRSFQLPHQGPSLDSVQSTACVPSSQAGSEAPPQSSSRTDLVRQPICAFARPILPPSGRVRRDVRPSGSIPVSPALRMLSLQSYITHLILLVNPYPPLCDSMGNDRFCSNEVHFSLSRVSSSISTLP